VILEEKKEFKIFLYAFFASLVLHAGILMLVNRLGKAWGWIPLDESFFEVSIISLRDKPAGNDQACHPSDLKAEAPRNKTAQKTIKTAQLQQNATPEKAQKNTSQEPNVNHQPGEKFPTAIDMDMLSHVSLPSEGSAAGTGIDDIQGHDGNEPNMPGVTQGSGVFGSRMNYLDMVRVKIENQKKYPDAAQQRNIEGQVTVEFEISLDGQITEPSVSKSSGHPALDLAAINAVKKASPFSSPPKEFFTDAIHINLPIRFELIR
jgi:TonB family protein